MDFGLEKCAVIHIKKGTITNVPDVQNIPLLKDNDSYKYLGFFQADKVLHNETKSIAKNEFFKQVKT